MSRRLRSGSSRRRSPSAPAENTTRTLADALRDGPIPFALLDDAGQMIDANGACRRLLGTDPPFIWREWFRGAARSDFDQAWTLCTGSGGFKGRLRTGLKGRSRPQVIEVSIHRADAPGPERFAAMLQDASESARIERDTHDWQARYEWAVRVAGDGILDWNLDTDEAFFSSRFLSIIGAPARRPITITGWQRRIIPADRAAVRKAIKRHLEEKDCPLDIEHTVSHAQGPRRVILRGQAIRDAAGQPYRLICSLGDITERISSEATARRRLEELAHVLRVHTAGEMVAGIAHELNQPLGAIANYAAGATRRMADAAPPEEIVHALSMIDAQAHRAGEIIARLRRFIARQPIEQQIVDLGELVRETVPLADNLALEHKARIRIEEHPGPLPVRADRISFEQALLNLITNAIEATATVSGKRMVSVRTSQHEGNAVVQIDDNGTGIASGVRANLLEPFITTKKAGLGMGLSLCRTVVESHQGRLELSDRKPTGTSARVALPLA